MLSIGGTIYAGYRYVDRLQTDIAQLTTNNAILVANNSQLEQGLVTQQRAIASLQRDIELQLQIFQDTTDNFEQARGQVDALRERLGRHELGYLAANRPGLVENVINNATDAIGRCFEISSGASLTQAERDATLPSQINTECPQLANPNYEANQ